MKKALVAVLAVILVAGCSSMPELTSYDDSVDLLYIARVENAAKHFGTQVVWMNLPQKRTAPAR
jgi:hypothetical protein